MWMPHLITLQSPRQKFAGGPSQACTSPHTASLQTSFIMPEEVCGDFKGLILDSQPQHHGHLEPGDFFAVCVCVQRGGTVPCRVFSSIPDFYYLDHGIHPHEIWQPKVSPDLTKCALGAKLPTSGHHEIRCICPVSVTVLLSAGDPGYTPEVEKCV